MAAIMPTTKTDDVSNEAIADMIVGEPQTADILAKLDKALAEGNFVFVTAGNVEDELETLVRQMEVELSKAETDYQRRYHRSCLDMLCGMRNAAGKESIGGKRDVDAAIMAIADQPALTADDLAIKKTALCDALALDPGEFDSRIMDRMDVSRIVSSLDEPLVAAMVLSLARDALAMGGKVGVA